MLGGNGAPHRSKYELQPLYRPFCEQVEEHIPSYLSKQTKNVAFLEQPPLFPLLENMASKKWDNLQRESPNSKHNNKKNMGDDGGVLSAKGLQGINMSHLQEDERSWINFIINKIS